MDYTITCRLSNDVQVPLLSRIISPPRGGGEHAPQYVPAGQLTSSALLFAYHFTASNVDSLDEVRAIVAAAFGETAEQFAGRARMELEAIGVERGSIDISVLVSQVTLWLHHEQRKLLGLASWAADKFAGGVVSEFGKAFAERILRRLPSREPPTPARIGSYEDIAQRKAEGIARAHRCRAVPILGGLAIRSGQGLRTVAYLYGYELTGDGTNHQLPKYVYVTAYSDARRPPSFRVMDEPLVVEGDASPPQPS